MKHIQGSFIGDSLSVAIVVSQFNKLVTQQLLNGAQDCLTQHGVASANITVAWVPGAFELPLIAKKMATTGHFNTIICLGAVIQGETTHYDFVCNQTASGISQVALQTDIPTIFGVLTTNTLEQALTRVGGKAGNKGWEAALAALQMCNLINQIDDRHVLKKPTSKASVTRV